MSKKKQRQLFLLLGGLVIVLILLALVLLYNRHLAAQEAASAGDTVTTGLATAPTELKWSDGTNTVDLVQDADGNWVWAEDAEFPLNTSTVQSIVSGLANPALREMEAADSLEAYGLGEGARTLETVDSEGNTSQLLIGSAFTDTDDETCYYAKDPDSDTILILDASLVEQLTDTVYDLADTSPMDTVEESQVTAATIQGAQTTSFTVQAQTVENDDGEEETEYHWYCGDTDVTDSSLLSQVTSQMLSPSFTSLAYWKPDGATLEACGFDAPITVTVGYTDNDGNAATQTLTIGGLDESGSYYYCSPDGGQSVYLAGAAGVTDLITVANSGFDVAAETA